MNAVIAEDLDELPADILAELEAMEGGAHGQSGPPQYTRQERLDRIAQAIIERREYAIAERAASGIEESLMRAEESYIGMDDANRHEFIGRRWCKPISMEAPLTSNDGQAQGEQLQSNVFVPVPARYVDAGTAKLGEILLPPDDKGFSAEPTPVPDLIQSLKDTSQVMGKDGRGLTRDATDEEIAAMQAPASTPGPSLSATPAPGAAGSPPAVSGSAGASPVPGQKPGVPLTYKDLAQEAINKAKERSDKAQTRMHDQLVEMNYTASVRKVLFDAGKLGVGVLKGPFPVRKKSMAVTQEQGPDGREYFAVKSLDKISPWGKRIDPWDFYPDPSCGEDIQEGEYTFEHDRLTQRGVRKLKKDPGYITEQIEKVIAQGPSRRHLNVQRPDETPATLKDTSYDVWHYYGVLTREEMLTINPKLATMLEEGADDIAAQVTLINDTVVRAVVNPLDSGRFPYQTMPWRRREGSWMGVGIPEQGRVAERIINSATRALLDNAGISAGLQIIVDRTCVQPADSLWRITRNKVWCKIDSTNCDDVRKAFAAVEFPNVTDALMALIEYGFKLYEESTNIPLITQGQSGKTTPETLGATQLQNNNANQLLRSLGYGFDDSITEPFMTKLHEWNLLDPKIPNDEKGDFKLNCHGSTSLVERAIQDDTIAQMAGVVKDPAFGIDPRKWMKEYLQSKRLDPRRFQYTPEEQEKLDSQPPPKAPAVEAAMIRAEIDKMKLEVSQQIAAAKAELDKFKVQSDTDRDTVYVQAEAERNANQHAERMEELRLKERLALLDYSNKRGISLEQTKAELAATTMKLQVQRELAHEDRVGEALKPPTEPPGKAKPGQSYES